MGTQTKILWARGLDGKERAGGTQRGRGQKGIEIKRKRTVDTVGNANATRGGNETAEYTRVLAGNTRRKGTHAT